MENFMKGMKLRLVSLSGSLQRVCTEEKQSRMKETSRVLLRHIRMVKKQNSVDNARKLHRTSASFSALMQPRLSEPQFLPTFSTDVLLVNHVLKFSLNVSLGQNL